MGKPMIRLIAVAGLALSLCACGDGGSKANLAAAQAFLVANAKAPGVRTLPSGVQYKVVQSSPATGPTPGSEDEVKVNYEGKLLNGKVFDSSFARGQPADFILGGLIPAWVEALQRMRPGDEWILYVPPAQGYGDHAAGPIPRNSLLVFRIQLLGVLPHAGQAANG
jgi:peptidylprolyl isomerase/FKBP-type peptidyl-prolyl cis-trans isomerase FklB